MNAALEFVLQHLAGRGIRLPVNLPYTEEKTGNKYAIASRRGIKMEVTDWGSGQHGPDGEETDIAPMKEIEVFLWGLDDDEQEGDPFIRMACEAHDDDGRLVWTIGVYPETPSEHFGALRGKFLPGSKSSPRLGMGLSHEDGTKWFDRLIDGFLNFTAPQQET